MYRQYRIDPGGSSHGQSRRAYNNVYITPEGAAAQVSRTRMLVDMRQCLQVLRTPCAIRLYVIVMSSSC